MRLDRIIAVRSAKTVYRDGDRVIKEFGEDYSKADILREAHNQALIEETPLNIPKIREINKNDGRWTIVMDFIPGKTLERLIKEEPARKSDYIALMVELQLGMHAQRAPKLDYLRDKMHRKIGEADLMPSVRYELQTRLDSLPAHVKVCHGDFQPSNIVVREGDGAPFILDWSHATQGNASADAARSYLLFHLAGDFSGAATYIKLFCERSGTAESYVKKWLPIVAASQSVKGNPAEREFLMHWIDVVEYE
ncbi:MAG: phosphotransferase [Oscillospiraceae bacterium]|jgi:serine/threonine protein kinase|nr:phosphotransferase [Oscillospiraceae bacterium]